MNVEESAMETVEISRKVFESRIRNVPFASWEDLLAVVAGKPSRMGYTTLHGESESAFHFDPVRVFGWVAMLLISVGIWGLVFLASTAPIVAIIITVLYGIAMWFALNRALAPKLAGVIWPNLPLVVVAVGALVLRAFDCCHSPQTAAALALIVCIAPHTLAAAWLMRGLPQDPDRAPLFVNLFVGLWAALVCGMVAVGMKDYVVYLASQWVLLLLGLAAVVVAGRLFIIPGTLGSVELVSWVLNVGALAIFTAVHAILEVPFAGNALQWPLYALVPVVLGILGSVFGRSFPVLLSACACLTIVIRVSVGAGAVGGTIASLLTFGGLGMAIISLTQLLQRSQWWAKSLTDLQLAMARAYGAVPATGRRAAPHDWNSQTQLPEV